MTAAPRGTAAFAEECQADLLAAMVRVVRGEGALPPAGAEPAPMLEQVAANFSLTDGEVDALVATAAAELDPSVAGGDDARACCGTVLSIADVVDRVPAATWAAFAPSGRLRRWRLVHAAEHDPVHGPLHIDERVLYALLGVDAVEPALQRIARPVPPVDAADRVPTLARAAENAARAWAAPAPIDRAAPVLDIGAPSVAIATSVAALTAEHLGFECWRLPASVLPAAIDEIDALAITLAREAALAGILVLLVIDDEAPETCRIVRHLVERGAAPLMVFAGGTRHDWDRPTCTIAVPPPEAAERIALWRAALGPLSEALDGDVDRLAYAFDLPTERVHDVARATRHAVEQGAVAGPTAWHHARDAARGSLDGLAQRIDARASWADLVLPVAQRTELAQIAAHARQRHVVGDVWGFASARGDNLAVTALFHGPSGVGKTLAARVLASELELDLYRVDLSQTVSKYVGETEKNLKEIFDRAEQCNAVVVFDEADALFGRRAEVHDAHDRYANIEVSYLLQRMESYRGLAILTTNIPGNLDQAFMRRLRHSVAFPFPDQHARREIWARAFPAAAPVDELDLDALARLGVSGAAIANIALGAAVLAADAGVPIGMLHLRAAARREYGKHDRAPSAAEFEGWPTERQKDPEPAVTGVRA